MNRTLGLLVIVLVLVSAGYGVMMAVNPEARPWGNTSYRPSNRPAGAGGGERMTDPSEYEAVALTLEIPAAADVPTGGAHGGNCPQTRLGNILGVTFARTHGLVIGTVIPGGPADKAGIKPGDMLGERSECPRTTLPEFEAGKEPREMKVNVRRPRSSSASASEEAKTEETASGEQEASSE